MMIVEFCGNPGCGKSTVCRLVLEKLRERGIAAFDYNERKERSKLANLRWLLSPGRPAAAAALWRFGAGSGVNKRTFVYSVKCAVVLEQLKRWRDDPGCQAVLFDEGLIQYVTTLSHAARLGDLGEDVTKLLRELYGRADVYVADCVLDTAENARRLNQRNTAGDRFVSDDFGEQSARLALKRANIDAVLEQVRPVNLLRVSTEDSRQAADAVLSGLRLP